MTYDVTPKEFGDRFGTSERTAQRLFCYWLLQGKIFIRRAGVPSSKYPEGKLLMMDRTYYGALIGSPERVQEVYATLTT